VSGGLYLIGLAVLTTVVVPVLAAAVAWRRRLLPGWAGSPAWVVDAVLAFAAVVVIGELLGAVGQFRRWPVAAACAVVGGVAFVAARRVRQPAAGEALTTSPSRGRWPAAIAVGTLAVVAAQLSGWTAAAYQRGIIEDDSVGYHLPFAARFIQDGWVTRMHSAVPELPMTFYPATSELLHGVGMLAFHRDVVSPALNLFAAGLVLLAAWAVGRSAGMAPATLVAVAVVVASPLMATTQGGSAQNDTIGLFFFLAAAAVLVTGSGNGGDPGVLVASSAAAGLAFGTKLALIAPAGALLVGMIAVATRGERLRAAVTVVVVAFVTGSFWYLRNWVRVGNPLPSLHVGFGPVSLPSPELAIDKVGFSVAHYATDGHVLRTVIAHGFRQAFGPAWIVVVVAAAVGAVLQIARGRTPVHRMLGWAAVAAAVAWAITPTTAAGFDGHPLQVYVTANIRYLVPALGLGLALLPLGLRSLTAGARTALTAALAALLAVELPGASAFWRSWLPGHAGVSLAAAAVVLAVAAVWIGHRAGRYAAAVLVVPLVVVTLAGGWPLQRRYLEGRYTGNEWDLGPAFRWARTVHGARIGTAGFFQQYPLAGLDLSNTVQYVGVARPHGGFGELTTCSAWRRAVADGRYQYVVTAPNRPPDPVPPQTAWTRADPGAREIVRGAKVSVFRIEQRPDPASCG